MTVLKGAEHQQISLSFILEGLKESEMNAKCKPQHSLSAGALLLAQALFYCITTTLNRRLEVNAYAENMQTQILSFVLK